MAELEHAKALVIDESKFGVLNGKVAVLTGGASGIGAATVRRLVTSGAHVYFCDLSEDQGSKLAKEVNQAGPGTATFTAMDVTDYSSMLKLFDDAFNARGRIDMGITCAGICDPQHMFEPKELTMEAIQKPHPVLSKIINVNLLSTVNFYRIAMAYMKRDNTETGPTKSITLVSSASAYLETPGTPVYSATKAGHIGLLRGMQATVLRLLNIRINLVCPWATDTPFIGGSAGFLEKFGIPPNTSDQVAAIIQTCCADTSICGSAFHVQQGKGWDIEPGVVRTLPQWLTPSIEADLATQVKAFSSAPGDWGEMISER